jgi:iron complex outermembrane receptor protein
VTVHIPSQTPLDQALLQFGHQTGIQVMFLADSVDSKTTTSAVDGTFGARTALSGLLENSGLSYSVVKNTVAITSESDAGSDSERRRRVDLAEVVVTAQKREERLQDVPVPVTVLTSDSLVESNKLRLQDYYSSVPGLSFSSSGNGDMKLALRGVTTGSAFSNPTVGILIDDSPYGSTTVLGGFRTSAPDIDPSDLDRVEVLRGPQGTLYGASSIGGLLKFVTVDPSTGVFSGRVQADVNGVRHGDGVGYGLRAAANVPIGDTLAVRASAFTRRDPGYLDDPVRNIKGVNQTDVDGGRLSALWRPSEVWSLKLSALFQNIMADGTSDATVQPGLGELEQVRTLRGVGGYDRDARFYSATLKVAFLGMNLISVSGYSVDTYKLDADLTEAFGQLANSLLGVSGALFLERDKTSKFTQEIRLSGSLQHRLDWLLGVFYTHEDSANRGTFLAVDPVGNSVAGLLGDDPYPTTYAEYAAFADFTVHVTDRLSVQIGGRESYNKQRYEETLSGPFYGGYLFNPPVHTKDNSFTYLFTPSFKVSPDLMVYARLASGYRPGGPNSTCILFSVPCEYQPDKTRNYELGAKGAVLDRRLTFDASVYYIDWKDIQITVVDPVTGLAYFTNGSRARSQGIELSAQVRPLNGLTLSGWVAWNDATLRSDLPPNSGAIGSSGDRLPASSRFSANLAIDEEWAVARGTIAFLAGSVSYVGDRKSDFSGSTAQPRLDLPEYVQTDIRGGLRYSSWTATVFLNNALDKRGVLSSLYGVNPGEFAVNYIQPRTVGISVAKTF